MSVYSLDLDSSSKPPLIPLPHTIEKMDNPNMNCFDVQCVVDAIELSARGIRTILSRLRKPPNLVTIYARFTNVPPDIANFKLSKRCRQLHDRDTRYLIVTLPGKPQKAKVPYMLDDDSLLLFINSEDER